MTEFLDNSNLDPYTVDSVGSRVLTNNDKKKASGGLDSGP